MPTTRLRHILRVTFATAFLAPVTLASALAQEPTGIYQDHKKDAALGSKKPVRIRLTRSPDVKLGRIGGVWGALGGADQGDSFFVGKTPDLTNLQISMNTPTDGPLVRYEFKGTDGQDVKTVSLESIPGQNVTQWIVLKGKITVDVLATSKNPTYYALHIWYPGGSVDSLNATEIAEISSGDFVEKPVIFSAKKGE